MTDKFLHQNENIINLRDKGVKNLSGKLSKGCVKNATTKLCIGSIPSTYQSIIYKEQTRKAFGTSQKRWISRTISQETKNKLARLSQMTKQSQQIINVSHSKKGYGPLISKQKRQWVRLVKTPGPGRYEAKKANKKIKIHRKSKTRQQKKSFPIKNIQHHSIIPGPGYYQYQKCQPLKTTTSGFKSSFQTKVPRDHYIPKNNNPGPGTYICEQNKQNVKKRQFLKQENDYRGNSTFLNLVKEEVYQQPGPGWYNHDIPNFKPLYEQIKMSRNFILPVKKQNFKNNNQLQQTPNPTHYKIKRMYDQQNQKLIDWSCFMSQTKRDPFKARQIQGPNLKTLDQRNKNFHFNIKNNWV